MHTNRFVLKSECIKLVLVKFYNSTRKYSEFDPMPYCCTLTLTGDLSTPNHVTSRTSQGHSLHQVWTLWDYSFLSYAPDKQSHSTILQHWQTEFVWVIMCIVVVHLLLHWLHCSTDINHCHTHVYMQPHCLFTHMFTLYSRVIMFKYLTNEAIRHHSWANQQLQIPSQPISNHTTIATSQLISIHTRLASQSAITHPYHPISSHISLATSQPISNHTSIASQ